MGGIGIVGVNQIVGFCYQDRIDACAWYEIRSVVPEAGIKGRGK